jgi:cold shock CspA family protein
VVKWFDLGRGVGVIALDGAGGEAVASRSAIHGGMDRPLVEGERVCFGVTRDSRGVRADNIRGLVPGWCAASARPGRDTAAREELGRLVETALWGDAADTCPSCEQLWDARVRQVLVQGNGSTGPAEASRRVEPVTAVWAAMVVLAAVTIAAVALSVVSAG